MLHSHSTVIFCLCLSEDQPQGTRIQYLYALQQHLCTTILLHNAAVVWQSFQLCKGHCQEDAHSEFTLCLQQLLF